MTGKGLINVRADVFAFEKSQGQVPAYPVGPQPQHEIDKWVIGSQKSFRTVSGQDQDPPGAAMIEHIG